MAKKDSNDLKEELRKEEAKEKFTNLAFELFEKGADDETVVRDLTVLVPNIDASHVQRLRKQWQSKKSADSEIEAIDRGEEKSLDNGGGEEIPTEEAIKPTVKPEITPEEKVAEKPVEKVEPIGETKPDDDQVFRAMAEVDELSKSAVKPDEKEVMPQGKPVEKTPAVPDEWRQQERAEIIRATEELRRAITSEIHAQESYEKARLEIENAKRDMDLVRSELTDFRHDVELLKLKESVAVREPPEQPVLKTESEEFRRFEEEISDRISKRVVGEVFDELAEREEVAKKEEKADEAVERYEKKAPEARKLLEKAIAPKTDITSELAKLLGTTADEARKWVTEKRLEVGRQKKHEQVTKFEPVSEKPSLKPEDIEEAAYGKIAEILGTTERDAREQLSKKNMVLATRHAKELYDKILRYLKIHKYLVVKEDMATGNPEVYHLKLTSRGALIGAGAGVPAGMLILWVILMLTGIL